MVIYKYVLDQNARKQAVIMPEGSQPLSLGLDPQGKLCIWAKVPRAARQVDHSFLILFTGMDTPDVDQKQKFLGTILLPDGLVIHCFDLGEIL
jgi:hypothetical protein